MVDFATLARFLGSVRSSTAQIELTASLASGAALNSSVRLGPTNGHIDISHSESGMLTIRPESLTLTRNDGQRFDESGVDNSAAIESARSACPLEPGWLQSSLEAVDTRDKNVRQAIRDITADLFNPWTLVVIPGLAGFAQRTPPITLAETIRLPAFSGTVAFRNIAIDLAGGHFGFEFSVEGAAVPDTGGADEALTIFLEQPDDPVSPTTDHVSLNGLEFDLQADVSMSTDVDSRERSYVKILSASFRADQGEVLHKLGQNKQSRLAVKSVMASFRDVVARKSARDSMAVGSARVFIETLETAEPIAILAVPGDDDWTLHKVEASVRSLEINATAPVTGPLHGTARLKWATFSFLKSEGEPLPEDTRMLGLRLYDQDGPVTLEDVTYDLSSGGLRIGAAGAKLAFDEGILDLGDGLKIVIPDPNNNTAAESIVGLTANLLPPEHRIGSGSVRVPSAVLTGLANVEDGIPLKDLQLDAHIKHFNPNLGPLRTIDSRSLLRFGITTSKIKFTPIDIGTVRVDGLGTALDIVQQIVELAGAEFDAAAFGQIQATANALEGTLGVLNQLTVVDFGLQFDAGNAQYMIEPKLTNASTIGVRATVSFKNLRPYIKYKWYDLKKFTWRESVKPADKRWWQLPVSLTVGVAIGLRFNTELRRIEFSSARVYLLRDEVPVEVAKAVQDFLYAYYKVGTVVDQILDAVKEELAIQLPDTWDINKARLSVSDTGEISLFVESHITEWN